MNTEEAKQDAPAKLGQMFSKDALLLVQHVGTATHQEHGEFVMLAGMNMSPVIEHAGTGKKWSLGWSDIIDLAVAQGIAKP